MVKIDIFSGFLGAGKTTLIKKLISEAYKGEKIVLIENEFGEIAIDGGFLQDAGIEITEMSQGCICCSLVGDFTEALKKVIVEMNPERIIIEPSGVGKLSDVIKAVQKVDSEDIVLNSFTTVCDAKKAKIYIKNFGEFYNDQVEHANSIVLSRTADMKEDKLAETVELIRSKNSVATIITTDWNAITGAQILETMEHRNTLEEELKKLALEAEYDDDEECDDPNCSCHHHHHHGHDEEECECGHHHHHEHECDDPNCSCHDHHGHHHHHADEVFESWGKETSKKYTVEEIENILEELDDLHEYGIVLRAKGIVDGKDGNWIHFDYVPGEVNVRLGSAATIGRLCVIGSKLNHGALKELFKA